jgi:hypothetical protein
MRDDIAADVRTKRGHYDSASAGMNRKTQFACHYLRIFGAGHDEGSDAEWFWVDAENELSHGGVSGKGNFVDTVWVDVAGFAYFRGQFGKSLLGQQPQPSKRLWIKHGCADPGYDVGAKRLLLIEHGTDSDGRAGIQVEQRCNNSRSAEVICNAIPERAGISRFYVNEFLINQHCRDFEMRLAQDGRQESDDIKVNMRVYVVQRIKKAH